MAIIEKLQFHNNLDYFGSRGGHQGRDFAHLALDLLGHLLGFLAVLHHLRRDQDNEFGPVQRLAGVAEQGSQHRDLVQDRKPCLLYTSRCV